MRSEANHQAYMGAVRDSWKAEELVAAWLRDRNDDARVLPKTYASKQEDVLDHVDNGDIEAKLRSFCSNIWRIYGVKGRSIDFTCEGDFPFPDLIVCKKSVWDHAKPKPRGFFSLNAAKTHVAIIWSSTCDFWTHRGFKDGRPDRGEVDVNYVCPKNLVFFMPMREEPHERKE